jgi:N-acetylglutamate synthase-like GNAT family acetyltransferase
MEFLYLIDRPEFLPTVAAWHHDEWGYIRPGDSVEVRQKRLAEECGHCEIPTTIIAVENGELLGSVSLLEDDMDTHKELSPWLASLFVAAEKRRKGIGAALVQRLIREAAAVNVKRLYLYTPSEERFYSRLGWTVLERTNYAEKPAVIMTCKVLLQ